MSDYLAAQITIGGCISRALAPRLAKLITQAKLSVEWGEAPLEPASAEELLAARRTIDGEWLLQLVDDDAAYGSFPDLEAFLVKYEIPFDRQSDAGHGHDGALVVFRPGRKPTEFLASSGGEPAVLLQPLWELEEQLRHFASLLQRAPRRELHSAVRRLVGQCWDSLPSRPAPLPTFEVGKTVGLRKAA